MTNAITQGPSPSKLEPFVSVVLPIRNEARFIERSISAVLAQDYPADRIEIIVADGMSTDNTRAIVRSFEERCPNVRLIDNPGRFVPTGLNAAIAQASGDILVRVDGHCEIDPQYIRCCVDHLLKDGVDGVGGPLETVGETAVARAIAAAMSSRFGVGSSGFRTVNDKTMLTDTIAFPAYTRAIVDRAGPFDEEMVRCQDDEYNYRLRKLGAKLLLAADVRSRYYSRSSLRSLWKQYYQYGYWKVRVMQKHPLQMRPRQFVPLAFVTVLLLSLLTMPFASTARWAFAFVAISYVVANLAVSLLSAEGQGWRVRLLFPAAIAILHVAYGLGFLVGLARFWNRWRDRQTQQWLEYVQATERKV
jgi:succinoglycan biosynthesis protein ExoA